MDRGRDIEIIGDINRYLLAFREAKNRAGRGTVVTDALLFEIAGVDRHLVHRQIVGTGTRSRRNHSGQKRRI